MQLGSSGGRSLHAARVVPNASGRLAQIRLTATADDFSSAENERYAARDIIHEELASLSGADPSASSPAA